MHGQIRMGAAGRSPPEKPSTPNTAHPQTPNHTTKRRQTIKHTTTTQHADSEQLYLDSGVIKVADFGLSKSLVPVDRHGKMTYAANQVYKLTGETGSYRYMAPEVFRHEPYSLKVDVYSFAMILFQLFETTTPFAGHDPVDAARQAAMLGARPGFPPRKAVPAMTEELRRLVADCWAADPDARPTFEDVVARLERLLKDTPKHAHYAKNNGECCSVQ